MPERTRTYSWADPQVGLAAARSLSGLEYLQAMQRGELPGPPIAATLNFQGVEATAGRVVFTAEPAEYHYNPIGAVHGGFAAALCDSAMACAVHSTLPARTGYTTLELKVNYIRPLTKDIGPVQCEGRTIAVGGRIATAEARLTDAAGTLYAHATTTCLIIRPRQADPAE